VVIAIVDGGVQLDHEEFAGRIVAPVNCFNETGEMIEENFFDDTYQTHGTSVASLAVAKADNVVGLVGVCPGCSVMPIQGRAVLGKITASSTQWGILHAMESGANIISLSLESGTYGDHREAFLDPSTREAAIGELVEARAEYLDLGFSGVGDHDLCSLTFHGFFELAEECGVLIVVGAGNSSMPGDFNPICYHAVTLCVGSITRRDDRSLAPSNISNYGFMVQVLAPGEHIYRARFDPGATDSHEWTGGTSIATPMVSGLAGFILSEHPELGPVDLRKIIVASARALAPDAGPASGAYGLGVEIDAEMNAWRRAFLRLAGRDDSLLLDGPAMQDLAKLSPDADNAVWQQPQVSRSAGMPCAALEWGKETKHAAMESDDCDKAVGPVIDAASAMELARLGEWRAMFAEFDVAALDAARAIDAAALVALALEPGAIEVETVRAGEAASMEPTPGDEADAPAAPGVDPKLRLERASFAPGETIIVEFRAPVSYPDNAWVGIVPAEVPSRRREPQRRPRPCLHLPAQTGFGRVALCRARQARRLRSAHERFK